MDTNHVAEMTVMLWLKIMDETAVRVRSFGIHADSSLSGQHDFSTDEKVAANRSGNSQDHD